MLEQDDHTTVDQRIVRLERQVQDLQEALAQKADRERTSKDEWEDFKRDWLQMNRSERTRYLLKNGAIYMLFGGLAVALFWFAITLGADPQNQ